MVEHQNAEKNAWESPEERQTRQLLAEVERLREAANRLLDVAAAAVRDGEPLHPDVVPEFDGLARAALAGEGDENE